MSEFLEKYIEAVKQKKLYHRMNDEQLAAIAGIGIAQVPAFMSGKCQISLVGSARLCKFFNLNPNDYVNFNNPEGESEKK